MTAQIILTLFVLFVQGFQIALLYRVLKTRTETKDEKPERKKPGARPGKLQTLRENWRAAKTAKEIIKYETIS